MQNKNSNLKRDRTILCPNRVSLKQEYTFRFGKNKTQTIPLLVRLLENPKSPIALPGKISLFNHDCLHILLEQDLSLSGEAFVVGFCMGNDPKTRKIHIDIFKFCSQFLYPAEYQFNSGHWRHFDAGFGHGQSLKRKSINQIEFSLMGLDLISSIREDLGIRLSDIHQKNCSYD